MDLIELGAIGELVGGVAVLATLVYLAVQVRHARAQVTEQSVATALETMQEAFDPIYEGDHLAVFRRGLNGEPFENEDDELYDRHDDPQETTNLAAEPANGAILAECRTRMLEWLAATSDVIPWDSDPRFPKTATGHHDPFTG